MHSRTRRRLPDSPSLYRFTGAILLAGTISAAESTPAPATTPPPVAAAASQIGSVDSLVKDALGGSASALITLRTAALSVDDRTAMAMLEHARATGVSRGSAVAACFVHHREAWVQRTAIITIGKLGADSPESIDLLVKVLLDPSPLVAQAAADALGDLRDARSWPPLIDLLTAKDANHVHLAYTSLQRQTRQKLPPETAAWQEWYEQRKATEQTQFGEFQAMLRDAQGRAVTAIDGLASLQLMRDQATSILLGLVDHPDAEVREQVQRHLRQWTGTLGGESISRAVDRAQNHAIAPPPPPPPPIDLTAIAAPVAHVPTVESPGFFESTYGMLLIVTVSSGILGVLLWFLRTPAGKVVQQATQHFTKRIARSRVVVMMSNGTKRIARHLPAPVKSITKRFTAQAKAAANHLAHETHRMLNPHKQK
jgi:hypothetical protein